MATGAGASIVCRLCCSVLSAKHSYSLWTQHSQKEHLPQRISRLLEIHINLDDGLTSHICRPCMRVFETLEKASEKLKKFRETAKAAVTILQSHKQQAGPLAEGLPLLNTVQHVVPKRKKECSSLLNVSPDTVRQRPSAKKQLSRRHLNFKNDSE